MQVKILGGLAALSPLKLFPGFGEFDGWLRQLPR